MGRAARGAGPFRSVSHDELVGSAGRRLLVLVVLAAMVVAVAPGSVPGAVAEAGDAASLMDATDPGSAGDLAAWHETAQETLVAKAEQGDASQTASLAQTSSGSISGTVKNQEGTGLVGICIVALTAPLGQGDPAAVVLSQSTGDYTLTGLAPDTYRLFFFDCQDHPSYAYEYFPASSAYEDASPIVVGEDQNLHGADAWLPRGARVSGTVVDAVSGAPAAGICAAFFDTGFRLQLAVATDTTGEYTMPGLRPGEYRLAFLDCNDTPSLAVEWWNGKPSFSSGDGLHLSADQDRVGVDARMVVGGQIMGTIATTDGSAAAGVCAAVFAADGGVMTYAVSSGSGSYTIPGVRSGEHRVLFVDCSSAAPRYEELWHDGKDSFEAADAVTVQAPGTTFGIDATLNPIGIDVTLNPTDIEPPPDAFDTDGVPDVSVCPDGTVPPSGFVDIAGNAHEAAIDCVAWLEITLGVSPDHFAPSRLVRRDQMASFLIRLIEALGVDVPPAADQGFTDIIGNTHADRINQLAEFGVTTGTTSTTYDPTAPVRRDQMASFLVRTIEMISNQEMPSTGPYFVDTGSSVHEPNIDKIAEAGISLGVGDGTRYHPLGEVRRDQMASFLARTLEHTSGLVAADSASTGDVTVAAASVSDELALIGLWMGHQTAMTCDSSPVSREIRIGHSGYYWYRAWLYRWDPSTRTWPLVATHDWQYWNFIMTFNNPRRGYYTTWVQGYNPWTGQSRWLVPVRYHNHYFGGPSHWQWCYMR